MNVHQKRAGAKKFPAGRFRAKRIWETRRLRVTTFSVFDLAGLPPDREAVRCHDKDAVEIRDISFNYGPWVPAEHDTREAFWRACGVRMQSAAVRML